MDNPAPRQFGRGSTYNSGFVVQTNGDSSLQLRPAEQGQALFDQYQFDDGSSYSETQLINLISGGALPNLFQTTANNLILGGTQDDSLVGSEDNDLFEGGAGKDTLYGLGGDDIYLFSNGHGQDTLTDSDGQNVIQFQADIDLSQVKVITAADGSALIITGTNESIALTPGTSITAITQGNVTLSWADFVAQHSLTQLIQSGTSGNDSLNGTAFNDTFDGGAGDDLYGIDAAEMKRVIQTDRAQTDGGNSYVLRYGMGSDHAYDSNDGQTNTLILDAGLTLNDLVVTSFDHQLKIQLKNSTDSLTFDYAVNPGQSQIASQLSNWVVLDQNGQSSTLDHLYQTTLDATQLKQHFTEVLQYQLGHVAGWGNVDHNVNSNGNNFGSFALTATPVTTLTVTATQDGTYTGGAQTLQSGSQTISGTYLVANQSATTATDEGTFVPFDALPLNADGSVPAGATPVYMQDFSSGVSTQQLVGFMVPKTRTTTSITSYTSQPYSYSLPVYTRTPQLLVLNGSAGDDTFTSLNSIVNAGAGNDRINTAEQNYTNLIVPHAVNGGYGMYAHNFGHFTYDPLNIDQTGYGLWAEGGDGNDIMLGTNPNFYFDGQEVGMSDPNTIPSNTESLGGRDVLIGGQGDDFMDGLGGNDIYIRDRTDGIDTIFDSAGLQNGYVDDGYDVYGPLGEDQGDVIKLNGVLRTEVTLSLDQGTDLNGRVALRMLWDNSDGVRVVLPDATDAIGTGVEFIEFGDGERVAVQTLVTSLGTNTTNPPNTSFVFNLGNGVQHLSAANGVNTIQFGAGITPAFLSLGLGSLLIRVGSNGDAIHIDDFDPNDALAAPVIQHFQFADGSSLTYAQLLEQGFDLSGSGLITGTSVADRITGSADADILDGGAGADTLIGGDGDDTYLVDNVGDIVIESPDAPDLDPIFGIPTYQGGLDTVQSTIDYTLGTNLENLTLTGTAISGSGNRLDNFITGNQQDNLLTGGDGADTLDGGLGADTLIGGSGSDTYLVDNSNDVIIEAADTEDSPGGFDIVEASSDYALSDNIETLHLNRRFLTGTGNALDNELMSNAGDSTLSGGAGNDVLWSFVGHDTLIGGTGDDTYILDHANNTLIEQADEGIDWVEAGYEFIAPGYTLGNHLENLSLGWSSRDLSGTGNDLNNLIAGNYGNNLLRGLGGDDILYGGAAGQGGNGNDTLDGGTGADWMEGGFDDDVYVVDNVGDVVIEVADNPDWGMVGGIDRVESSITYTLGDYVENLTLTGTEAIDGTGNALDNWIIGNTADNTLRGAGGDDILIGSTGNDTYQFSLGGGQDVLVEDDSTAGNSDLLQFMSGVTNDQLWFQQAGNDLVVSVIGTTDNVTLSNWYLGSQYQVETLQTVDGNHALIAANVNNLVQAMASFTPPAAGQTTLPTNYQSQLAPVIAANWT